ncbi:hypothetical protein GCK72_009226 [Caenorhabditis remanei]|uniref:C6 domain-containing protein n=1 Tax=Caenorhabditis remanei TaxID=31234 RepID=A0A6A5H366_CAERE|nr:hypothetical protein GCK72_009226 [Caenorhabditis remanei]KAF1760973.1 hypothetical protein GCK72_009226 [Caenorhabditis remanei]
MNFIILLSRLIILTVGCIPTVPSSHPVVSSTYYEETTTPTVPTSTTPESTTCPTTTFFSSTTSTVPSNTSTIPTTTTTSTTTTTPVPTTTPLGCCAYPFRETTTNPATPSSVNWVNCSSIFIQCQITNDLNMTVNQVSIVGNWSSALTMNQIQINQVAVSNSTSSQTITATVQCDRNLRLWYVGNRAEYYSDFDCFIRFFNGTYLQSG